ncbi:MULTISPECIES: glycosyltransferase [unclassified Oceanispirochaeta]|uniref:glycosyltransferase n=1 Tax=unclassified Oceanispirochaeta TaxID=2635722 RepID=UPI000E095148|nr:MULTISPECIES: glycosyltransferase [unclassified Oceanispirochaeta]MBF9014116.1 glycosyltransferase [Oceanispirochaeta sp. M2]NPD70607.1 glycosyltransferase [Oceanispirochaeta sp. M1]RDG34372.1 glycosyltransferase family 4 protein [Oceanispirochaeta sp. M1]
MNIAIFSDAFYPQINGVVTSIVSVASNMAERGHRVIIVAPSYRHLEEIDIPGVKIIRVPSISASFYEDFKWTNPFSFTTYKTLRKENIDLIHFMTPIFISMLGIKFARKRGLPVVGTFHTFIADPSYSEHMFSGPVKVSEEVIWKYLNLYYDCADYVTAPTEEAVRIISENGCTAPLEAVSNGIDFKQFDNSRSDEFSKKYSLGNQVVLYVGRVAYEKNLNVLIDAFDLVYRENKDAQLLIVGDGPQRHLFEEQAAGKDCGDNVIFTGALSHSELVHSGIFKAVSLFATASVTETQGITILEAQANSLICVGAEEGGVVNLIEDGVNGYLVPPGDSNLMAERISHVLKHRDDLADMERKALEMVDIHRMDKIIDRWEEIYTELYENRDSLAEKDYLHFNTLLKFTKSLKVDFQYLLDKIRKPRTMWARNFDRNAAKHTLLKKLPLHKIPVDKIPGTAHLRTGINRLHKISSTALHSRRRG